MVHDDLLEQIRQPWWDRVDRRLAVILAVSITAHLAIAIASWLGDPTVTSWLDDPPQPAFAVETLDEIQLPDAPPAVEPAPGAGAIATRVVAAVPSPAPLPGHVKHRSLAPEVKPIDARALVGNLVGDAPSFAASGRRVGRELDDQLAAAGAREDAARVGNGEGAESIGIGAGAGPDLAVDTVKQTAKPREVEPPPPAVVFNDEPAIPFDPGWMTTEARLRALKRCYRQSTELLEQRHVRLTLAMTLGVTGKVTAAKADGTTALADCVASVARTWKFPVALQAETIVRATLIFVPN